MQDFFSDCLLLADDFSQYYLGAFARLLNGPESVEAGAPLLWAPRRRSAAPRWVDNPLDEVGAFTLTSACSSLRTSSRCSPARRPPTTSRRGPTPSGPSRASAYVVMLHADATYAASGAPST